jgi:hypothetical protein
MSVNGRRLGDPERRRALRHKTARARLNESRHWSGARQNALASLEHAVPAPCTRERNLRGVKRSPRRRSRNRRTERRLLTPHRCGLEERVRTSRPLVRTRPDFQDQVKPRATSVSHERQARPPYSSNCPSNNTHDPKGRLCGPPDHESPAVAQCVAQRRTFAAPRAALSLRPCRSLGRIGCDSVFDHDSSSRRVALRLTDLRGVKRAPWRRSRIRRTERRLLTPHKFDLEQRVRTSQPLARTHPDFPDQVKPCESIASQEREAIPRAARSTPRAST